MAPPPGVRRVMRPAPGAVAAAHTGRRPLTLAAQCMALAHTWPQLRCRFVGRGRGTRLVCRGALRPSPVTRTYEVRIEYTAGGAPHAFVEAPHLVGRPDVPAIPHTYSSLPGAATEACLFYPPDGDWREDRPLAATVVPWLLEWLVFYELWLSTGVWQGGGVEHAPAAQPAPPNASPPATD